MSKPVRLSPMAPETAPTVTPYKPCPPKSDRRNRPMKQVKRLQDVLFSRATAEGLKPSEIASLARAWCDCEERRRVLTGKPLPGSFRPEKKAKAAADPFA